MTKKMEDILREEGILVSTMSGVSMEPMLRDRRDTVIIKPCTDRLKRYDVALFKYGSKYVLHRVVKVCKDSYIMRGDNCIQEEYGVKDAQVLGVLTGFYREEKPEDMNGWKYKTYVWIHCKSFYIRWLFRKVKGILSKILRLTNREGKLG